MSFSEVKDNKVNSSSIKIENQHASNLFNKRLVIRFTGLNKIYSLEYEPTWLLSELNTLIKYLFKKEASANNFTYIYNGNPLDNNDAELRSILNPNEEIPQIFVILKPKSKETNSYITALANKPKTQIFESDEFSILETLNYSIHQKNIKVPNDCFNSRLGKLPLFHPLMKQRFTDVSFKTNTEVSQNEIMENFPVRGYFKLGLMVKLFFMFFLFGFGMKGLNCSIFVSLLVIYYWYIVNTDIQNFYNERLRSLQLDSKDLDSEFEEEENNENDDVIIENSFRETVSNNNEADNLLNNNQSNEDKKIYKENSENKDSNTVDYSVNRNKSNSSINNNNINNALNKKVSFKSIEEEESQQSNISNYKKSINNFSSNNENQDNILYNTSNNNNNAPSINKNCLLEEDDDIVITNSENKNNTISNNSNNNTNYNINSNDNNSIYEKQYFSVKDQFVDPDVGSNEVPKYNSSNNNILKEQINKEIPNDKAELNNNNNNETKYILKQIKVKSLKELNKENNKNKENEYDKPNFFLEFLYSFIISLHPNWCDQFEIDNPIINNNNNVIGNAENDNNNRNEDDKQNIELKNINENENIIKSLKEETDKELLNNLTHENNKDYCNKENKIINDNNSNSNEQDFQDNEKHIEGATQKVSINTDLEGLEGNQDAEYSNKNSKYEKILLKSSHDTRKVNYDDQSKKFNLVQDDIKTENEIEFSENAYIDNISYNNESVFEAHKKHYEEIKEIKENSKDIKEDKDNDKDNDKEIKVKANEKEKLE